MPISLKEFAEPGITALVIHEMQEGVVGKSVPGPLRQLADVVEQRGVVTQLSKLLRAARKAGVKVFHCPAFSRADDLGSMTNTPLHNAIKKMGPRDFGSTSIGAANVPGLEPEAGEWIMWRSHAMTGFHDTSLDSLCRNMGIRTIVVTGVSLNCGVIGVTIEAINRAYRVIVPTDCVAGFPAEYGDMVLKHSLSGLSFLTTAKELAAAWGVNWNEL
jgi:nicotinamidase-related amidase